MFANTNKPLHVSVLFIRPSSGYHIFVYVLGALGEERQTHTQINDIHLRPHTM